MNKFLAIALLAFVAVVAAQEDLELEADSAVGVIPKDNEEVNDLSPKNKVFSDFCLATRDHIVSDLRGMTNNLASGIFGQFFRSIEDVTLQGINTEKDASEKLGEQIRNPDAPIQGDANSVVTDGQQRIQDGQGSFFNGAAALNAVAAVFRASASVVANGVAQKLAAVKATLGLPRAIQAIGEVCEKVAVYEQDIRQKFNDAKSEFVASDPSYSSVNVDQVECVTSRRILRIEGLCKFARVAQGPLMRIMTYRN